MVRAYDDYGNIVEDYEEQIRAKAIEECKEVVRQLWIKGYLFPTIAGKIYGELEKLKEDK